MESGKGDDPCVTFESPCPICASFTEEQMQKIAQRKRYIRKQKGNTVSSKDDELDLLGEYVESFTGTNADVESAADNLFTSPPRPQPLPFSLLSLKTPAKTVPATPGTALQQKIETNLQKSLGNTLNLHLQQQMGSFQASMLEAFQSLRDEISSKKQAEVVQTSASASKPGTSAVNLDLPPPRPTTNLQTEDMDVDYDPALPPGPGSDHQNFSDQNSNASEVPSKGARMDIKHTLTLIGSMMLVQDLPRTNTLMNPTNLGCHLPNPKNMLTRVDINLGCDMFHLPQRKISPLWLNTGLLSPLGITLIKTNLNMIQTPLIIGK